MNENLKSMTTEQLSEFIRSMKKTHRPHRLISVNCYLLFGLRICTLELRCYKVQDLIRL